MKIRDILGSNETTVLRDLSKVLHQTPEQFVRAAVNAAFDQLIEDGKPVPVNDGSRVAWVRDSRNHRIRGGSLSVGEWLVAHT